MTPTTSERRTVAYEENDQTAGILGFNSEGGLTLTESGRERYNAFIERFGRDTIPETKKDFGITPREDGNYDLTLEGAERWNEMNLMLDRERIEASDDLLKKIK